MKQIILALALPFAFGLALAEDETPVQTPNQNRAPMYDGQGPYGPRGPGMINDEEARKYREQHREEMREQYQQRPYDPKEPGMINDEEARKYREQHREEMREQYQQRPYGPGYQRGPNQPGAAQRPATPPQQ